MNKSQLNAIWYADRNRKLEKLEKMGLAAEYKAFKGNSNREKIEYFCRAKGITL